MITPPIVVIDRDGEVGFYASAGDAGVDLESPDVVAGEYRAFDSLGHPLALAVEGPEAPPGRLGRLETVSSVPVQVRWTGDPARPEELRGALIDAVARYGEVPAGLAHAPLAEVIALARQRLS